MGGQACVFYGAAEFSRDVDIALLADGDNLERLRAALLELEAETIAVPPFDVAFLLKGHAVHFGCHHPEANGVRLDVMAVMRGVDPFPVLWERRTTVELQGLSVELLSLPDLVRAKKTQRDQDWPMIRRLVEADYFTHRDRPTDRQIEFWLKELRTPALLIELAAAHQRMAETLVPIRPLLRAALDSNPALVEQELTQEQERERERDRRYWEPLRAELQELRRDRR